MTLATIFSDTVGSLFHRSSSPAVQTKREDELELSAAPPDTRRLIRDGRYCTILSAENQIPFDDVSVQCAWRALTGKMALVPGGEVTLLCDAGVSSGGGMEVATIRRDFVCADTTYFDRHCVTNAEYQKFVDAGGYDRHELWPPEVLPNVLQFVDATGCCGPKGWTNGKPPADQLDHPVVGICWYEASAYAIWAGKRLPSTAEWQRAGVWSLREGDGNEPRYPWGNAFDPTKANLWSGSETTTVAVGEYSGGRTPNGVGQLIGNVWEWVDAQYLPETDGTVDVLIDHVMAEIRGGSFDTYFQSQATCQFRSGQPLHHRSSNVGFRCCVTADHMPLPPSPEG
tara:strand:+ start:27714 stop:28736 length:1023 start_codon:yes stop_codon:yes gene_type:complete